MLIQSNAYNVNIHVNDNKYLQHEFKVNFKPLGTTILNGSVSFENRHQKFFKKLFYIRAYKGIFAEMNVKSRNRIQNMTELRTD